MAIIAFLSEPFTKQGNLYISNKASLDFIESCFDEPVIAVGGVVDEPVKKESVSIKEDFFEETPFYKSIVDFFKQALKNPFFLKKYIANCHRILNKYNESAVWVRNPSIGCLIFSVCALKNGRLVYNHMCANAMNAWDSPKYRGFNRVLAYMFSLFLKRLVNYVIGHDNTINLCTGSELLDICLAKNKKSYLLIDSTIEKISLPRKENGFKSGEQGARYLFIGRVQEDKGILDLIKVFEEIKSDHATLDVIGTGELLEELKESNKSSNVNFLGQVPNKDISYYLSQSDVLVVPSKNRYEGFPRVILEAWACGLPIVVTNVGGVSAFVKDGYNGYLIPGHSYDHLKDAIVKIMNYSNYSQLLSGVRKSSEITTKDYWVRQFRDIGVH